MNDEQPAVASSGDPLLRSFAEMAQVGAFRISVTLNTAGAPLTGLLIGRDAWLSEFRKICSGAGEFGKSFGENLEAEIHGAELENYLNEAVFEDYIHLKNAYYVYESRLLPTVGEGVLWRGRLASVTGWSLGSLNT